MGTSEFQMMDKENAMATGVSIQTPFLEAST
jgi:hypothetical protein